MTLGDALQAVRGYRSLNRDIDNHFVRLVLWIRTDQAPDAACPAPSLLPGGWERHRARLPELLSAPRLADLK
jgi:hypothetical protein